MSFKLPDIFLQRGWRYFRYNDGLVYVLDPAEGYFGAVPEQTLGGAAEQQLFYDTSLRRLASAWPTARSSPPASDQDSFEVQLALLGGKVLARFAHARCRDDVARYFSCSTDDTDSSPDVIVECDWKEADRYLFRARPEEFAGTPLGGVRVRARGEAAAVRWLSRHPPLPPLSMAPFKDRFLALHAAVVRDPDGRGIALLGDRNTGKSTCALDLCRRSGYEFLGDETAFVHLRTTVAEPFPQGVGIRTDRGHKTTVPAAELFPRVGRTPTVLNRLVLLAPTHGTANRTERLSPADTLRALLPHQRDASAPLDDAVVTLDRLARETTAIQLSYSDPARLTQLAEEAIQALSSN